MNRIVAGIDIGGERKGFHAVTLEGVRITGRIHSTEAGEVSGWCLERGATIVGLDAPCRWAVEGKSRPVEREMARAGLSAYATPTCKRALTNPFYHWMLNGERLYQAIEAHYPLFTGSPIHGPACFETFPSAVVAALAGRRMPAKDKRRNRPPLLQKAGIDISTLTSIDWIDAGLCALTARHFADGMIKTYGESRTGLIVVPVLSRGTAQ